MANSIQLYLDKGISSKDLEKIYFLRDGFGPTYRIEFRKDYEKAQEGITKNDYYIKELGKNSQIIEDTNAKKNLLGRLVSKNNF
jgi:hypothetical protein